MLEINVVLKKYYKKICTYRDIICIYRNYIDDFIPETDNKGKQIKNGQNIS